MEKTFEEVRNYVLDNLDVLMYYDRDQLLRDCGYEDGIKQGKKSKSIEIAKKMLSRGDDIEDIIELTDLSKKEIHDLQGIL